MAKPQILVHFDDCIGESLPRGMPEMSWPIIRPGAVVFMAELRAEAHVIVGACRPRRDLIAWLDRWGIDFDEVCDLRYDSPPVALAIGPRLLGTGVDPGPAEFDAARDAALKLLATLRGQVTKT